jgi:hypothetical protein
MDEALRAELVAMIDRDDQMRERLARDGSLFQGYHPEMEAVHRENAARLTAIVDTGGWPGRSQVGDEAASAAWRILQHAIGEPALMRRMFAVLRAEAARGEADPAEVAMLDDRIRVFEGRLQRYGTQYHWNDDGTAMVPMVGVEDAEHVDERRSSVGLPPMQWTRPAPDDEPPPTDMDAHRAEAEAWARRVGWR